jgi:hypothetical protein
MKKSNKRTSQKEISAFSKRLNGILEELQKNSEFEIRGDLRIGVITNLDALAIIKGNWIYVNFKASKYPKAVLRYIVSHELAHIASRQHRKKFWGIVARIDPEFADARRWLIELQSKQRQTR